MSKEITDQQKIPDQLSDILLVMDNDTKKIQAVKGIKNGNLETVDPEPENQNQFMRIDRHGDFVSNFFTNFLSQLKNPTRFSFFRSSASEAKETANEIQKYVDNPSKEGEAVLSKFEVKEKKEQNVENKNDMANTQVKPGTSEYRYKPEQIDWETMSNLGLSKERLEKLNLLDPLLKGFKTNELVPISLNLGTTIMRTDARLSLQANNEGKVVVAIHGIRKEPQLSFPFFGHEFSKEDKENLLKTGNMGRVVELTNRKTGEPIPSLISIDRLTNEVIAFRVDRIKLQDEIKGVKLNEHQKQTLMEGKPLYMEGMISKKGSPFNASVQFNADKGYVEFLFDRSNNQTKTIQQQAGVEAPRIFRGKELDEVQYNKYKSGETIYITGLVDKKGQEYKGYLTFNKDTGRTDFSFSNPNKMRNQVQPAEAHKTQTAVNSEGKTNEATKKIYKPLKSSQKAPDNKKQEKQQKRGQTQQKSSGRKME